MHSFHAYFLLFFVCHLDFLVLHHLFGLCDAPTLHIEGRQMKKNGVPIKRGTIATYLVPGIFVAAATNPSVARTHRRQREGESLRRAPIVV